MKRLLLNLKVSIDSEVIDSWTLIAVTSVHEIDEL